MIKVDQELFDMKELNDNFPMSKLFELKMQLIRLAEKAEKALEKLIKLQEIYPSKQMQERLYFINKNLSIIEDVMICQESLIFEVTEYSDICLN
jgi:hypothetical protein